MFRMWMASLAVILAAHPATAQTRVRLDVESDTWLPPTPFDAFKELSATLTGAGIEISDDPVAPRIHILYEETSGPGIWPRLVPATHIVLHWRVSDSTGELFESSRAVRPTLNVRTFPSAAELRVLAIEQFRQHESFRLLGHRIRAVLGVESSFRSLLSERDPDAFFASMLFSKVSWSSANDDIFVRAFRALRGGATTLPDIARDFLQKNLTAIRAVTSNVPLASPQLAMLLLEDYGNTSAREVLTDLTMHPVYGSLALRSLRAIDARNTGPTSEPDSLKVLPLR